MANSPGGRPLLIALLLVLGVDLGVIVVFVVTVVARRRWIRRQAGAFGGAVRVAEGDIDGIGPAWRRGHGRWVRDVLVWTKAPFLFRTRLLPVDELSEERAAHPGEVKRLGERPAVVRFVTEEAVIEVAADGDHRDLLRGPFGRSTTREGRATRHG